MVRERAKKSEGVLQVSMWLGQDDVRASPDALGGRAHDDVRLVHDVWKELEMLEMMKRRRVQTVTRVREIGVQVAD